MRKIVSGLFLSVDGVYESPDQWHFPYWSDEMGEAVQAQMEAADAILLGRVGYQEFAQYWPQQPSDGDIADFMNNTPKYVVSNTLTSVAEWQNSTLLTGDAMAEVRKLKEQPGKNIAMTGSGTLVASLIREGLLDELNLLVHPILVGNRKRLFATQDEPRGLQLVETRNLPNGVLYLSYQPAAT
ncbi:MAG TPA: dihydrofolate reductase family protein [Thermomicrobiales bacterium]|nr:dihydrofolate reductase family protein [Thermomicrobiales bacterium]